jgi:CDGSH-type Zn-finger protein
VEIAEKKKVAWCMCKHTANPPFCDGSHAKLA